MHDVAGGVELHAATSGGEGAKPILVLQKVRRVLDAFTGSSPELTLAEIRQATEYPASTCTRLVHNLVREGLLVRTGDTYRIGVTVLRWSAAAVRGLDLVATVTPLLEQLRDDTGESAALFVRQGPMRTCVAVVATRHPIIWQLHVGLSTPLHAGSGGRALLAFDEAAISDVLAAPLEGFTARTITDARVLCRILADTRRSGVACSDQEWDRDVAGVSAPVFGPTGVVAALGVAGPSQRFGPEHVPGYARAVLATARAASRLMGGEFPSLPEAAQPAGSNRT
jgi:DNA-binding IclR family transcriptional regulator